jgi:hypothetical protein
MNDTHAPGAQHRTGNGRTPQENHEYARLAANSMPRETQVANAAAARAARSAKLAREIDPDGTMDPAELQREISRRKAAQLAKARAVRLTMIRRAREAGEALVAAAETIAEATDIAEA